MYTKCKQISNNLISYLVKSCVMQIRNSSLVNIGKISRHVPQKSNHLWQCHHLWLWPITCGFATRDRSFSHLWWHFCHAWFYFWGTSRDIIPYSLVRSCIFSQYCLILLTAYWWSIVLDSAWYCSIRLDIALYCSILLDTALCCHLPVILFTAWLSLM